MPIVPATQLPRGLHQDLTATLAPSECTPPEQETDSNKMQMEDTPVIQKTSSRNNQKSAVRRHQLHHPPPSPAAITTRSEPNSPYPATFVQADASSFKQVVQMLTGSAETTRLSSRTDHTSYPIKPIPSREKLGCKLYERRNRLNNFKINPLGPRLVTPGGSARTPTPEALSPSIFDFPSLMLSPVTPLIPDPFNRPASAVLTCFGDLDMEAEEKAIREKGFYLHPSPASTPRESEPRLLPLFPLTSPRSD